MNKVNKNEFSYGGIVNAFLFFEGKATLGSKVGTHFSWVGNMALTSSIWPLARSFDSYVISEVNLRFGVQKLSNFWLRNIGLVFGCVVSLKDQSYTLAPKLDGGEISDDLLYSFYFGLSVKSKGFKVKARIADMSVLFVHLAYRNFVVATQFSRCYGVFSVQSYGKTSKSRYEAMRRFNFESSLLVLSL